MGKEEISPTEQKERLTEQYCAPAKAPCPPSDHINVYGFNNFLVDKGAVLNKGTVELQYALNPFYFYGESLWNMPQTDWSRSVTWWCPTNHYPIIGYTGWKEFQDRTTSPYPRECTEKTVTYLPSTSGTAKARVFRTDYIGFPDLGNPIDPNPKYHEARDVECTVDNQEFNDQTVSLCPDPNSFFPKKKEVIGVPLKSLYDYEDCVKIADTNNCVKAVSDGKWYKRRYFLSVCGSPLSEIIGMTPREFLGNGITLIGNEHYRIYDDWEWKNEGPKSKKGLRVTPYAYSSFASSGVDITGIHRNDATQSAKDGRAPLTKFYDWLVVANATAITGEPATLPYTPNMLSAQIVGMGIKTGQDVYISKNANPYMDGKVLVPKNFPLSQNPHYCLGNCDAETSNRFNGLGGINPKVDLVKAGVYPKTPLLVVPRKVVLSDPEAPAEGCTVRRGLPKPSDVRCGVKTLKDVAKCDEKTCSAKGSDLDDTVALTPDQIKEIRERERLKALKYVSDNLSGKARKTFCQLSTEEAKLAADHLFSVLKRSLDLVRAADSLRKQGKVDAANGLILDATNLLRGTDFSQTGFTVTWKQESVHASEIPRKEEWWNWDKLGTEKNDGYSCCGESKGVIRILRMLPLEKNSSTGADITKADYIEINFINYLIAFEEIGHATQFLRRKSCGSSSRNYFLSEAMRKRQIKEGATEDYFEAVEEDITHILGEHKITPPEFHYYWHRERLKLLGDCLKDLKD